MNLPPSLQAPGAVVMVRPAQFRPNPETSADNAFQRHDAQRSAAEVARAAALESTLAAEALRAHGVCVHVFDELPERHTPDAVFPNNWFSTHADGKVVLYPMHAASRRRERRSDIIDMLKENYAVREVVDLSALEGDQLFLEGTGAMVLDHVNRVAYMARSSRADARALAQFCARLGYEPMVFEAQDPEGRAVYHTNVMMSLATEFALVGLALMADPGERARVQAKIAASGREVVALSARQIGEFAGNALELSTPAGRVLAMSARAAASLEPEQKRRIERYARIAELPVPTIELAGGSVRCMLAGIHLTPRKQAFYGGGAGQTACRTA